MDSGPSVLKSAKPPFEDLYREFLPRIYGYVRAQVEGASAGAAEDVTSQVFMKAFEAYPRYRPRAQTPAAWLFTIARNAAGDHRRRQRAERGAVIAMGSMMPTPPDPAEAVEAGFRDRGLLEAVRSLADRQREVVALRHGSGMTFAEIGRIMGCSEDAAKMLHHRALRQLRDVLTEEMAGR